MRCESFVGAVENDGAGVMSDWDEQQVQTWHRLFGQVAAVLERYGHMDPSGRADYWINGDNYGWSRISVGANNLKMLNPDIVNSLRGLLSDLPEWEITVAVDMLGKESIWPNMGLTIRKHEIIDGLQRKLLPPEFAHFAYPGSRPGTGND